MIDRKVFSALTETASPIKCKICGATSKEINNLKKFRIKQKKKKTFNMVYLPYMDSFYGVYSRYSLQIEIS